VCVCVVSALGCPHSLHRAPTAVHYTRTLWCSVWNCRSLTSVHDRVWSVIWNRNSVSKPARTGTRPRRHTAPVRRGSADVSLAAAA
jgi:hypothetical protein